MSNHITIDPSSNSLPSPRLHLHKLNGDSSWLLRLPFASSTFNLLIDPWLDPTCQIDGIPSFSKQTRIKPAQFANLAELSDHLSGKIDAIIFSHPFTDHMHPETLRDEKNKDILRQAAVITTKDSHAALMGLKLDLDLTKIIKLDGIKDESVSLADSIQIAFLPAREWFVSPAWTKLHGAIYISLPGYEILYTPHGIAPTSLPDDLKEKAKEGIKRILIHSFDKQTLPILGPVTLGFPNIKELNTTFRPDVVLGTHDEHKQAEGFIARIIKRTEYSIETVQEELGEAVEVKAPNAGDEIKI